ncbi:MAG: hypothetical protein P8R42_00960 [Candidatus Binatia bacterium]|nr:hypothetical protein [Candidatus Binatia bacterium]
MRSHKVTLAVLATLTAFGCSVPRPVVYPNEHLQVVGQKTAKRDIDVCIKKAEGYVEGVTAGQVAKETAIGGGAGAAIGAAAGAAGGAAFGNAGGGAAAGAAGGAVTALLRSAFKSTQLTPAQQGFVNRCLTDEGYQVIGWQ